MFSCLCMCCSLLVMQALVVYCVFASEYAQLILHGVNMHFHVGEYLRFKGLIQ